MISESALTKLLKPALRREMPGSVVIKHSDSFTGGIPDLSVDWKCTAWLEVKATEKTRLEHHRNWGLQHLMCTRLATATGLCWFVVYQELEGWENVQIYRPHEVSKDRKLGTPEAAFDGYQHQRIAQFVKEQLIGHHPPV